MDRELRALARRLRPDRDGDPHRHPSFVTGTISGRKCVVCQTHIDDYHSFALVVTGWKIFYILRPGLLPEVRTSGGEVANTWPPEVSPFNKPWADQPWEEAVMGPGDILYLPPNWVHAVASSERAVMTNSWFPETS